MNNLDKQYTDLLQDILDNGVTKSDRTGTGTLSVFGRQIRHKMSDGFPLLTTKKLHWKSIVTELLWFLQGRTDLKWLLEQGNTIWVGDAYKRFLTEAKLIKEGYESGDILGSQPHIDLMFSNPEELIILSQEQFIEKIKTDEKFSKRFGNLGPVYGAQWRDWLTYKPSNNEGSFYQSKNIDQITNLIQDLKTNPDSRRLMVNAWNVGELGQMVLPPCHYGFQVYTRELVESERYGLLLESGYDGKEMNTSNMMRVCDELNIPTRAISLMWNQRSVDTFLGLPFNIASYGLLLEIIAKAVNMIPDELIGNLGDVHLYSNHVEQAKEQIGRELSDKERYNIWFNNNYETGMERFFDPNDLPNFNDPYYEPTPTRTREPYPLPKLMLGEGSMSIVDWYKTEFNILIENLDIHKDTCFELENYQSHPTIKAPLSN